MAISSFYRTLLEDEMTHLDDNNDGSAEMKEIQDIVDDTDANEAEQQQGAEAAFGPDDNVEDIIESTYMAIAESEMAWNTVMQQIGIRELSEASMGREVIYEAGAIRDWFRKAKDKIVAFFKKVWQVIQRWAGNFVAVISTNKRFVEKYADKIRTGAPLYKNADKKLKGYPFTGLTDNNIEDISIDLGIGNINKAVDAFKQNIADNKFTDDNIITADLADKTLKELRAKIAGGGSSGDESSFRDDFVKNIRGADEPTEITPAPEELIGILKDKKNRKESTKKIFDKAKKEFKTAIDKLNRLEKTVNASHNKDSNNNKELSGKILSSCIAYNNMLNKMLNTTQIARSVVMAALNAQAHQARKFANAYVAAANKGKYKGFQKESAEYGLASKLNLV